MMPPRHWPLRRQRLLALALTVLAILLTTAALLGPVIYKHRQYDATLDDLVFQIQRLEHVLARREAIETEKVRLSRALAESETTLPPVGVSVAGARLQTQLQGWADATEEFTINSVQSLEPATDGSFTHISVRIQARGHLAGLKHFLYAVETASPMAWVDNLQIQPDRRRTGGDRVLEITMNVTALMTSDPAEAP